VGVTIKKIGTGTVTFTAMPQLVSGGSVSGLVVPSCRPPAVPNLQSNVAPTPADAGVTVAVNVHFSTLPPPTCVTLQSAVVAAVGVTVKFAEGATVVVVVEADVVVVDVEVEVVVVLATVVVVVLGTLVVVVGDDVVVVGDDVVVVGDDVVVVVEPTIVVVVVGELVVVVGELVVVVGELVVVVDEPGTVVVDEAAVVVVDEATVVVVAGGGDVLLSHAATSAQTLATASATSIRLRRSIQHLCDSG